MVNLDIDIVVNEKIPQETVRFNVEGIAKGYITLQGYKIISGDVSIKFPKYNRGTQIDTSIVSSDAFILQQVWKC